MKKKQLLKLIEELREDTNTDIKELFKVTLGNKNSVDKLETTIKNLEQRIKNLETARDGSTTESIPVPNYPIIRRVDESTCSVCGINYSDMDYYVCGNSGCPKRVTWTSSYSGNTYTVDDDFRAYDSFLESLPGYVDPITGQTKPPMEVTEQQVKIYNQNQTDNKTVLSQEEIDFLLDLKTKKDESIDEMINEAIDAVTKEMDKRQE
jgi:hypothetical protein